MNFNPVENPSLDYRSVLDVTEAEPRTDDGWTKIGSKTRKDMAKATVGPSGLKRAINMMAMNNNIARTMNAMKTSDCKEDGGNEHGYVCDRQREGKQRLTWKIEHIDG